MALSPPAPRPVLVVEDHDDTRLMIQEILKFYGFETIGASDGLRGLTALKDHRPCLILLDLSMPVMDGWRFRLEQQHLADGELAKVPVVILSALHDADTHAQALAATDVIGKPVDLERMVRVVREHYGQS